jgi:hypothetical protein
MNCSYCNTRLGDQAEFVFCGWEFCCGCMADLCSWFLDGGTVLAPDMFAYVLGDARVDLSDAIPV